MSQTFLTIHLILTFQCPEYLVQYPKMNRARPNLLACFGALACGAEVIFCRRARKKRLFCEVRPVTKAPQAENFRADPPRIS